MKWNKEGDNTHNFLKWNLSENLSAKGNNTKNPLHIDTREDINKLNLYLWHFIGLPLCNNASENVEVILYAIRVPHAWHYNIIIFTVNIWVVEDFFVTNTTHQGIYLESYLSRAYRYYYSLIQLWFATELNRL